VNGFERDRRAMLCVCVCVFGGWGGCGGVVLLQTSDFKLITIRFRLGCWSFGGGLRGSAQEIYVKEGSGVKRSEKNVAGKWMCVG
jgi:hypothetical protein